ncbi:hypothetical protein [Methanothrix soehngenii]|uniref:hypothetical protein n=1 Tax=Methanothrix soehngenii TaxID=2223 RepID=UPI00300DB91B
MTDRGSSGFSSFAERAMVHWSSTAARPSAGLAGSFSTRRISASAALPKRGSAPNSTVRIVPSASVMDWAPFRPESVPRTKFEAGVMIGVGVTVRPQDHLAGEGVAQRIGGEGPDLVPAVADQAVLDAVDREAAPDRIGDARGLAQGVVLDAVGSSARTGDGEQQAAGAVGERRWPPGPGWSRGPGNPAHPVSRSGPVAVRAETIAVGRPVASRSIRVTRPAALVMAVTRFRAS